MVDANDVEDFTYSCGVHTPKRGIFDIYYYILKTYLKYYILFHNKSYLQI